MPAHRLALAAPLGATGTIDVRQASLTTAGYEPDVLLECSGMPKALTLRLAHVQNFEIELTGTFRYANTWPTAIALSASGAVDLDRLVTHRFGLADVEQALTVSTRDKTAVKAVVYPQEQRPTWWRRVEAGHMVMEKWPSSSGGPVGTASTFSRLLTTVRAGIEEHRNVHYGSDATHRHVGPPQHRMRTHGTAPRIDPSPGAHARGEQVGADPVTRGEQKVRRLFDHLVRIAPRHVEHVRGFLRGQHGVARHDVDGLALCHRGHHLLQHLVHLMRQRHTGTVRAHQLRSVLLVRLRPVVPTARLLHMECLQKWLELGGPGREHRVLLNRGSHQTPP
ncbi:hypothetical protein [Prauserella flavalba]|nr:hypothetical protein [Prauserella flavalba]